MQKSYCPRRFLLVFHCMVVGVFFFVLMRGLALSASYSFLQKVTKANYPNDHVVLAKEVEQIIFHADGSHVDEDEVYLTVLDQQGKEDMQVQSFYFDKNYSTLTVETMEVIRPRKGKPPQIIAVDLSRNSRVQAPSSNTEMNIYDPSQKVMKIFIPDLDPGDTIHYRAVRKTFKSVIPDHIYGLIPVQQDFPVHYYHLEFDLPANRRLHHMIKDPVAGTVRFKTFRHGNSKKFIWDFREVPKLVPEPHMVPFVRVAMRLLYSTLDSWEQVSRWYFGLVEPKLTPTRGIRQKVKELIRGKADKQSKIAAIFYYVAQKIRYLGITAESNRPGFEPHEVGLTFSRRYGVCRDKAALLVSMLRVAGFKAAAVLLSMGRKLDGEVVVPYFNHAIAATLDESGSPSVFMDPTSETSKQLLPDYDRDCSYLVADRKGTTLGVSPVQPPETNLVLIQVKDRIAANGTLHGELKAISFGFADTIFRSIMLDKSYDEQKRFLTRFVRNKRAGITIDNISWTDPLDRSVPFGFSCSFRLERATLRWTQEGSKVGGSASGKAQALWPLCSTPYIGLLDRWILGKANLNQRKYPLKLGYVFASKWVEEMNLDGGVGDIVLPVALNKENDVFSSWTSFSVSAHRLLITKYFALKKLEVSAHEYPLLTRLEHDLKYEAALPIIVSLTR